MNNKNNVVIGTLGIVKDAKGGRSKKRWEVWRPTLGLVMQPDFPVHRLELFYPPSYLRMAQRIQGDVQQASPSTEVVLIEAAIEDPWDFAETYQWLYDFFRTYAFDPEQERYFLHMTTGTHVHQICLFLMSEARLVPGKLLQTSPVPGTEFKAPGGIHTVDLDLSRYDVLAQRFYDESKSAREFLKEGIATRNPAFNRVIAEIERVALASTSAVLLGGPTGAGKTHMARKIYELKASRNRVEGSFVPVNCATLMGDGAMSALFGHRKGAFTGATSDRDGYLKLAHKGVLFLDEIGELGLDEQAMLLHAVEEQRFYPVGSDRQVLSEFQLIAGTNRDLRQAVLDGRFREDLLARIDLWHWELPALKDRPEDFEANLDFELQKYARSADQLVRFNHAAKAQYLDFATSPDGLWKANFRDLNASVTRLATLSQGGRIREPDVDTEILRLRQRWGLNQVPVVAQSSVASGSDGEEEVRGQESHGEILRRYFDDATVAGMDYFDQLQLASVIQVCKASRSMAEAGRRLFNASRQEKRSQNDSHRIRIYLKKFGLEFGDL